MPFRTALSGLNAAAADLSVTSNNIANAGTVGFKESRAQFVDVYAVAYQGIGANTPGSGVRLSEIAQQFTQGNIDYTNNNLDLAISGSGFFILSDSGARTFTRAGAFHVDRDGYVVNGQSQQIQVFPPVTAGATVFNTAQLTPLQISSSLGSPNASTLIEANLNVDAGRTPITVTGALDNVSTPLNVNNPNSFHSSTATTVYDSLGVSHNAVMYYRKVDTAPSTLPNTWQSFMYVDGTEVPPSGMGAGTPAVLTFNTDGSLNTVSPVGATPSRVAYSAFNPGTGATNLTLEIDNNGTTQFGSPFAVNGLSQDGYTIGRLSSMDVDSTGTVFARFSNGQSNVLGKVALANFPNPNGLRQMGDTTWGETYAAGDVMIGEAGGSNFGLIQSGALEASNVDIAEQLVNLITAQRNYQANAQVISTADTITQTIINMR